MSTVRVGIIGFGNAGQLHYRTLRDGHVPGAEVTAVVCRPGQADLLAETPGVLACDDVPELLSSGRCDAVIIATPHSVHAAQATAAFGAGLHVLCEKPAALRAGDARAMAAAAERAGVRYAVNFNRRTASAYAKLHALTHDGTIGDLRRAAFTSTSWLRSQAYYDSSPWRGTWSGDGGGLLLNQLPHILDLWQWTLGMPRRLLGRCGFGRRHRLEVEDEAFVLAEYANGATATLVGSTGEAPGVDRVEIVGDRATLVLDGGTLTVTRLDRPTDAFIREASAGFDRPGTRTETMHLDTDGDYAAGIIKDFVRSVREGTPLLAPGADAVASLDLANAILLSQWEGQWIDLPTPSVRFDAALAARQAASTPRRPASARVVDLNQSFVGRALVPSPGIPGER